VIDFKLSESSWGIFMYLLIRFGVQFCSGDPAFGRTLGAIGSTLFIISPIQRYNFTLAASMQISSPQRSSRQNPSSDAHL
jgi:hypothetical protein